MGSVENDAMSEGILSDQYKLANRLRRVDHFLLDEYYSMMEIVEGEATSKRSKEVYQSKVHALKPQRDRIKECYTQLNKKELSTETLHKVSTELKIVLRFFEAEIQLIQYNLGLFPQNTKPLFSTNTEEIERKPAASSTLSPNIYTLDRECIFVVGDTPFLVLQMKIVL